jgi:hypothetical protein
MAKSGKWGSWQSNISVIEQQLPETSMNIHCRDKVFHPTSALVFFLKVDSPTTTAVV